MMLGGYSLTNTKLLKLCSLFDLFNLQDCAAELLINYRHKLEKEVNVDLMLNILTKEIAPQYESYAAYMEAIRNNPSMMFNMGIPKRPNFFKRKIRKLKKVLHKLKENLAIVQ